VSDQPTPVDLKIQRGTQILEFHVPRVRESTLAELSEQKYARLMYFPDGERLLTVPLDESTEELKAFGDYELQLGQRYGFKLAEGHWVPQATPEDRFKQVEEFLGHTPSARFVMRLYHLTGRGWYGPDFSALLLKDPRQLLVELIEPASPAYSAGLLPGDEILEIDGRPVAGLDQKQLSDLMLKPDEHAWQVTLRIRRGASEMTLGLKTEPTKDLGLGHFVFKASKMPGKPSPYALGAEVVTGVGPGEAVVSQVTYPSAAFRAGLLVGDRIVTVNGKPTDQLTPDQLTSELLYPASAFEITLDISRLGRRVRLRIVPLTAAEAEAEIDRKMTAHGPASALCTDAPL
jgi:membrane-associated protease RseP (regulator of RpoE activity)